MDTNRKAILIGGIVTAVSTIGVFLLPILLPLEAIKMAVFHATGTWMFGNPFVQLRLFGGVPGALVGGYLARDHLDNIGWGASMRIGLYAALFGLALILTVYMLYNIYSATVMQGMFPPPIYIIIVVPLIFSIPLFPAYLIEGLLFGVLGGTLGSIRAEEA